MGRKKATGRRERGTFFGLPHAVMDSPNYTQLSSKGVRLLNDLGRQFNGSNNGDLCAAWSVMEKRGWKSRSTLHYAIQELLHFEFVTQTRQGGRHKCSLYALTWLAIDECKGKLDVNETNVASGKWKESKAKFLPKQNGKHQFDCSI